MGFVIILLLVGLIFVKIRRIDTILLVFTHTMYRVNRALYHELGKYDSGFL
jgi:hypothetical protein